MPRPVQFTSSLLSGNILFLTVGSFAGTLSILLFENRLYTATGVLVLFFSLFVLFIIHAFAGSMKQSITWLHAVFYYTRSFAITFFMLCIVFFLEPLPFDLPKAIRLCFLVTLIETSLQFFRWYKKQAEANAEKEKRISQTIKEQRVRELEVLKQQIDPHFIFNSFNTLSFLIEEDSRKARDFSNKLASVYRYLIFNSSKNLVSLADEAGFAKDYAYLQEIRYSNEVQISFTGFERAEPVFVVPVSLQILLENAIKHNAFSETAPLHIRVWFYGGEVWVQNKISSSPGQTSGSKIGLSNLRDRCHLIMGKELAVEQQDGLFTVRLPVLQQ